MLVRLLYYPVSDNVIEHRIIPYVGSRDTHRDNSCDIAIAHTSDSTLSLPAFMWRTALPKVTNLDLRLAANSLRPKLDSLAWCMKTKAVQSAVDHLRSPCYCPHRTLLTSGGWIGSKSLSFASALVHARGAERPRVETSSRINACGGADRLRTRRGLHGRCAAGHRVRIGGVVVALDAGRRRGDRFWW